LALVLIFLTIEMFTLDFTFLMIGIGSGGGLLASLVGAPWFVQFLLAAAVSALLIFSLRPPLLRRLRRKGDPTLSNIEGLTGLDGVVLTEVSPDGGQVNLSNGETWTAKLAPTVEAKNLAIGHRVVVLEIEGATALVAPEERTAQ
jgi:membrane protein implicated in regulation of membrane protease activity